MLQFKLDSWGARTSRYHTGRARLLKSDLQQRRLALPTNAG